VCNLPDSEFLRLSKKEKKTTEQKLTVYTSKNCPRCRALKKWLRRNSLSFTEKSLDDTSIMTELVMRNLFILSAPALETENRVYLSDQIFDADNRLNPELKKILKGEPSKCKCQFQIPKIDPLKSSKFRVCIHSKIPVKVSGR
jgi:arsenate reductase-like glutaredoxin family protein